jgi:hemerythrin-like domain-containing protein
VKAVDILMNEHQAIERLLYVLRCATERLSQGQAVRPGLFLDAVQFIREAADGHHHKKEEQIFFKAIAPYQQKIIEVLLEEHVLARTYTSNIAKAALAWQNNDPSAGAEVMKNARLYADLLQDHIAHENKLVFPVSTWLLPEAEQQRLDDKFAALDAEPAAWERWLTLLAQMESEIQGEP